jgi:hypothetical protein
MESETNPFGRSPNEGINYKSFSVTPLMKDNNDQVGIRLETQGKGGECCWIGYVIFR